MMETTGKDRGIGRVLFLYPPTRIGKELLNRCMPPLGAPYLAAMVREDYDVGLLDATSEGFDRVEELPGGFVQGGLSLDEVERRVLAFRPDFVAITCLFSSNFPVVVELARRIKGIDPAIRVGVGGTHTNYLWREAMTRSPHIDFIGLGEGELVIRDLLRALNGAGPVAEVDGLVWRKADGEPVANPKEKVVEELDSLPFPARDLIDWELYRGSRFHHLYTREELTTSLLTSRGCPAKCIFCSSARFWGHRFRARSPENVVAEIEEVVEKYGIKEFSIEDDNLTLYKKRAKALFRLILDRGLDVKFTTPNGIALWSLDEELLELMKAAGVYHLTLAIESGDQQVLNEIVKKPLDLEKARRLARKIHDLGFETHSFFIIGFPGETIPQMKKTIRYAHSLPVDSAAIFVANPLPGSELHEMAEKNGWLPPDFRFEDMTYSRGCLQPPGWRREEVERLANLALFKYHVKQALRHPIKTVRRILADPGTAANLLRKGLRRVGQSFSRRKS